MPPVGGDQKKKANVSRPKYQRKLLEICGQIKKPLDRDESFLRYEKRPLANLICDVIRKKITGPTLRITVLATRDAASGVSLATAVHAHSAQDQPYSTGGEGGM